MYARILRGNSDTTQTTTARKQTKCDAMPLLISFNCFLKKRKKAKEARKRCIQGGGKNETLTRMNYYRHLRRTFRFTSLGSFFYHINGIICIIIVVSIIILSRSLSLTLSLSLSLSSLSLSDYYTRAASHELRSALARRLYSCSCGPSPRFPFLKTQTR